MASPSSPSPTSVLVVEDDASLRRLLEMRLTLDGYAVRTACDGREALDTLAGWRPDVIITDVMMPRLSGLRLCHAVRADERLAALPIILLTARCFDDDIQEVLDLGGVVFMNKPFDAERLGAALTEALGDCAVTRSKERSERIR